ncbi:MAG: PQQ-dependent sugar dehydrogenase [Candidatus Dormibacteria bacterium]
MAALAGVAVLAACGSTPRPTASASPEVTPTTAPVTGTPSPTADACVARLNEPAPRGTIAANFATALAFAPDGRLFWAERSGTIRVWQEGVSRVFAKVNTVTTQPNGSYSERGLLGLAISPSFATDRFVYAFYSDASYRTQHVIRWYDCDGTGLHPTMIATFPAGNDCCHKGGRIAFGPDGKLYVTLGDEHDASSAQNVGDVLGKVLRYNPDGTIPPDNPFGRTNPVWAYGLRNPFGIAFSPTGELAITMNGPSGDAGSPATGYDTLYLNVSRGAHYPWPDCYGYSHPLATSTCGGGIAPNWSSETSTYVPTGATFVDASGPAGYAGHLVFCTYDKGMAIATPGSPHASVRLGPSGCRFDVVEGPNHALYYSDVSHIYELA